MHGRPRKLHERPNSCPTTISMEIWRDYYDSFVARVARIPADAFERKHLLYEAAHETYEEVTNKLTEHGVDSENALFQGKRFSTAVKRWIDGGARREEDLQTELRDLTARPVEE